MNLILRIEKQFLPKRKEFKPDVIIHCAAYTKVDQAEIDKEVCYQVNVTGTENMVLAAKESNAKIIYISTDYVFDGEKTESMK